MDAAHTLEEIPEHLIVVARCDRCRVRSAYNAPGSQVTLISSRDQVLPGEDADAARVIEDVFKRNGMTVPRSPVPSRSSAPR